MRNLFTKFCSSVLVKVMDELNEFIASFLSLFTWKFLEKLVNVLVQIVNRIHKSFEDTNLLLVRNLNKVVKMSQYNVGEERVRGWEMFKGAGHRDVFFGRKHEMVGPNRWKMREDG
jgi:hypothetical protein